MLHGGAVLRAALPVTAILYDARCTGVHLDIPFNVVRKIVFPKLSEDRFLIMMKTEE